MSSGRSASDFILGTISTGDGFYTILDPSQKGFGAIYALSLKNVAKNYPLLSILEVLKSLRIQAILYLSSEWTAAKTL